MLYLLYAYIVIFGIVCVLMFVTEAFLTKPEEQESLGEFLVDVLCFGILLAGMIFLARGVANDLLKTIWLFAASSAAVVQLVLSWRGRRREMQRHDAASAPVPPYWIVDVGTLCLILPALAFNLYFACGGQLGGG